jgi:hypothetical protein
MIIVSKKSLNENLHISHQLRIRKMFYDNSNRHLPFERHKKVRMFSGNLKDIIKHMQKLRSKSLEWKIHSDKVFNLSSAHVVSWTSHSKHHCSNTVQSIAVNWKQYQNVTVQTLLCQNVWNGVLYFFCFGRGLGGYLASNYVKTLVEEVEKQKK